MAGAAVIASNLWEFAQPGANLSDPEDLVETFDFVVNNSHPLYERSLGAVPKLSEVNEKRLDILEELTASKKRYAPNIVPKKTATDQSST